MGAYRRLQEAFAEQPWLNRRAIEDSLQMLVLAPTITLLAGKYNLLGWVNSLLDQAEASNLGNMIIGMIVVTIFLVIFLLRRSHDASIQIALQAEREQQVMALARRDALTGLSNRRHFNEMLAEEVMTANASGDGFALFLLDLDRFKPVNDVYGHAAGDEILRQVGERISEIALNASCVARIGGDEFAILLSLNAGSDQARVLAEKIQHHFETPFNIDGKSVSLGVSLGIAFYHSARDDVEALFLHADVALYNAKRRGRNHYCFYSEEMADAAHKSDTMDLDIKRALRNNEFVPYFQPLVDLRSGRVVGMEVLARWIHPVNGVVEPDHFVPAAERLSIIGDVTFQVLRKACMEALDWDRKMFLAVNISQSQLRDQWLPERMLALLTETGFPGARIEVEITEDSLVDDIDEARAILYSLKNQGISIALDDFGTGYSSLVHLRDLPLDKIKIDRSFIMSLKSDVSSAKIVSAILGLGNSLGLPTVAEGIETEEIARTLADLGCAYGQGYLYSKPLPADEAYERYGKTDEAQIEVLLKRPKKIA